MLELECAAVEVTLGDTLVYHPFRGDILAVLLRYQGGHTLDNGSEDSVDEHGLVGVDGL